MFVLLLGSYDDETKDSMYELQECIARSFLSREDECYALIMERLGAYLMGDFIILTEQYLEKYTTLYVLDLQNKLLDVDSIETPQDIQYFIHNYLAEKKMVDPELSIEKVPNIVSRGVYPSLFSMLVSIADIFIIVRLREETRGGEYIEICYLVWRIPNMVSIHGEPRIFLFRKEGITLTTMLDIVAEDNKIVVKEFFNNTDLCIKVVNIVDRSQRRSN
ncbi:MAG: hypothetical protein QXU18_00260 [Thermoplasmatales archaeon]